MATAYTYTLTPGWHNFEIRLSNGGGGSGASGVSGWVRGNVDQYDGSWGFGYDPQGRGLTDGGGGPGLGSYVKFVDPGNASFVRYFSLTSLTNKSYGANFKLDEDSIVNVPTAANVLLNTWLLSTPDKTLTLPNIDAGVQFSGTAALAAGTYSVNSPGLVNLGTLNDGAYSVVISKQGSGDVLLNKSDVPVAFTGNSKVQLDGPARLALVGRSGATAPDPLGAGAVCLNADYSALLLAAGTSQAVAFDNAVVVNADAAISAVGQTTLAEFKVGVIAVDGGNVTLGGVNGITIAPGKTLTLSSSDNCVLKLAGPGAADSTAEIEVTGGSLIVGHANAFGSAAVKAPNAGTLLESRIAAPNLANVALGFGTVLKITTDPTGGTSPSAVVPGALQLSSNVGNNFPNLRLGPGATMQPLSGSRRYDSSLKLAGTVNVNTAGGNLTITGPISDDAAGPGGLVKAGGNTLTLGPASGGPVVTNYTGPTTVNGGTFTVTSSARLGDGTSNTAGITVNGAAFNANGPVSSSGPITMAGTAPAFNAAAPVSAAGPLNANAGTVTISGDGGSLTLTAQTAPFVSGSSLWLDAAAGGTMTLGTAYGGTTVAQWRDKLGGTDQVGQNTDGNRPVVTSGAAGINNLPVVHFDAGRGTSLWNGTSYGTSTGMTMLYVGRMTGMTSGRLVTSAYGGNNWLLGYHWNHMNSAYFEGWTPSQSYVAADADPHIWIATISGQATGTANVWRADASGLTQLATDVAGRQTLNRLGLGAGWANDASLGSGEFATGDVGELLIFPGVIDFSQALSYLENKWFNVPVAPIAGALNVAGATVNVNAGASAGGVGALSGGTSALVRLSAATTLTVGGGSYSGQINGQGGLRKDSANTLTLITPHQTFGGGVTISAGTLLSAAATTGTAQNPLGSGNLAVTRDGTLQINPGSGRSQYLGGIASVHSDGLLIARSGTVDFGDRVITANTDGTTAPRQPFFTSGNNYGLNVAWLVPDAVGAVANAFLDANVSNPFITFTNANTFATPSNPRPGARAAGGNICYTTLANSPLSYDIGNESGWAINAASGNWFNPTPGLSAGDDDGASWTGIFRVGGLGMPAGPYTFGLNSDDGSSIYLRINGAWTKVVDWFGSHGHSFDGTGAHVGTVNLTAGDYPIRIGWYNGDGGQAIEARFGIGSISTYNALTIINPGDSLPSTANVEIDAGATLKAAGLTTGTLTLAGTGNAATLTLTDSTNSSQASTVNAIALAGSGALGAINLGANKSLTAAALNLDVNAALTVAGPGTLTVNSGSLASGSHLELNGARMIASGVAGLGQINVNGGGVLAGPANMARLTAQVNLKTGGTLGLGDGVNGPVLLDKLSIGAGSRLLLGVGAARNGSVDVATAPLTIGAGPVLIVPAAIGDYTFLTGAVPTSGPAWSLGLAGTSSPDITWKTGSGNWSDSGPLYPWYGADTVIGYVDGYGTGALTAHVTGAGQVGPSGTSEVLIGPTTDGQHVGPRP